MRLCPPARTGNLIQVLEPCPHTQEDPAQGWNLSQPSQGLWETQRAEFEVRPGVAKTRNTLSYTKEKPLQGSQWISWKKKPPGCRGGNQGPVAACSWSGASPRATIQDSLPNSCCSCLSINLLRLHPHSIISGQEARSGIRTMAQRIRPCACLASGAVVPEEGIRGPGPGRCPQGISLPRESPVWEGP